jgi:hypothetical protein
MTARPAGILALLALVLAIAACQPGAAVPGATQAPGATTAGATQPPDATEQADPSFPAEVFFLDGTVSYTFDSYNGNADSFVEIHKQMTLNVHLTGPGDGGPGFKDAGSTYSFSETTKQHDAQTISSCGLEGNSSGTGGGPFASPGLLVGYYSYFDGTASLGVHAPYRNTSSLEFPCNPLANVPSGTADDIENTSCGDPSGGDLVGKVTGKVVDFTCTETFAIGTGSVVVKGTLTSR